MICNKCGRQLEGKYTFCPYCGAAMTNNKIQTELQTTIRKVYPNNPLNDPRGMKWFRFIINFWIFAYALGLLMDGILITTGLYYQGGAANVYNQFGNFKALDMIFGLIFIALSVASIFVRQKLAKFCVNGPKLFVLLLAAGFVTELLYIIITSELTTGALLFLLSSRTAISLTAEFAFLIINDHYLKKRVDLFVN